MGIDDDLSICNNISNNLSSDRVFIENIIEYEPEEIKWLISHFDFFIGSRFHSLIESISVKVPSLAIGWNEKYNEMMDWVGLRDNVIHISAKTRFIEFMSEWRSGRCSSLKVSEMIPFLLNLAKLENIKKHHIFSHDIHLALSELYRINRNFQETINHLDRAYIEHPTVELLINKAEMLASAGLYKEALRILNDTSLLENRGLRAKFILAVKRKKIDQLKNVLKKKI